MCLHLCSSEPSEYILSFDTSDNPLNITVVEPYSLNYFMLIADWGANPQGSYVGVQQAVADKMKSFYQLQKANGKNLLFIAVELFSFFVLYMLSTLSISVKIIIASLTIRLQIQIHTCPKTKIHQ